MKKIPIMHHQAEKLRILTSGLETKKIKCFQIIVHLSTMLIKSELLLIIFVVCILCISNGKKEKDYGKDKKGYQIYAFKMKCERTKKNCKKLFQPRAKPSCEGICRQPFEKNFL